MANIGPFSSPLFQPPSPSGVDVPPWHVYYSNPKYSSRFTSPRDTNSGYENVIGQGLITSPRLNPNYEYRLNNNTVHAIDGHTGRQLIPWSNNGSMVPEPSSISHMSGKSQYGEYHTRRRHIKRRSPDILDTDRSYKRQRVEEEISNQMVDFHISSKSSTPVAHAGDSRVNVNSSENDMDTDDEYDGPRLHMDSDLSKNIRASSSSIPPSIIRTMQEPCMQVVLWKPKSDIINVPIPLPPPPDKSCPDDIDCTMLDSELNQTVIKETHPVITTNYDNQPVFSMNNNTQPVFHMNSCIDEDDDFMDL